jgi:hypothetical protein
VKRTEGVQLRSAWSSAAPEGRRRGIEGAQSANAPVNRPRQRNAALDLVRTDHCTR